MWIVSFSFACRNVRSKISSSVPSFIHSFILSFTHSFMYLYCHSRDSQLFTTFILSIQSVVLFLGSGHPDSSACSINMGPYDQLLPTECEQRRCIPLLQNFFIPCFPICLWKQRTLRPSRWQNHMWKESQLQNHRRESCSPNIHIITRTRTKLLSS